MSKNSAKARSEGEGDSSYGDISPNVCSGASSYRDKRALEAGPYGDIPQSCSRQGAYYNDYMVVMLQDDECFSGTSEYSENDDQELYSLRNEYLQKLNIVRKRLNLMELSNNNDKYSPSGYEKGCKITEIIEEADGQPENESGNKFQNFETIPSKFSIQRPAYSANYDNKESTCISTRISDLQKSCESEKLKSKKFNSKEPDSKIFAETEKYLYNTNTNEPIPSGSREPTKYLNSESPIKQGRVPENLSPQKPELSSVSRENAKYVTTKYDSREPQLRQTTVTKKPKPQNFDSKEPESSVSRESEMREPKFIRSRVPEKKHPPGKTQFVSKRFESRSCSTGNSSDSIEIETIHPFSLCYNTMNTDSITNLLELEYNPPKKKSCFRMHTPKLPSASESIIPYHTKVSLHEGLFKKPDERKCREITATQSKLSTTLKEKFTVTKEIQCDESELESTNVVKPGTIPTMIFNTKNQELSKSSCLTKTSTSSLKNDGLYPQVIVKYESPREIVISSCSTTASSLVEKMCTQVNPPNLIEVSSGESLHRVRTFTTILKEPRSRKKQKKVRKPNCKPTMSHLWQELREMNSKAGDVDAVLKEKSKKDIPERKKSLVQYITYRKDKGRAKTSPIKIKTPVPFGPVLLQEYEKIQNMDSKYYFFNSTSSEEEKYVKELYAGKFDSTSSSEKMGDRRKSWTGLFSCLEPLVSIFRRNR